MRGRRKHEDRSDGQRRLGDSPGPGLLENGHEVTLWSYREEESTILREKRENPMLKGVPLPDGLALTSDRECVKNCKVVVLATPSFAVRTTARAVASLLEPLRCWCQCPRALRKIPL